MSLLFSIITGGDNQSWLRTACSVCILGVRMVFHAPLVVIAADHMIRMNNSFFISIYCFLLVRKPATRKVPVLAMELAVAGICKVSFSLFLTIEMSFG
jgi:hypothetical protein